MAYINSFGVKKNPIYLMERTCMDIKHAGTTEAYKILGANNVQKDIDMFKCLFYHVFLFLVT